VGKINHEKQETSNSYNLRVKTVCEVGRERSEPKEAGVGGGGKSSVSGNGRKNEETRGGGRKKRNQPRDEECV